MLSSSTYIDSRQNNVYVEGTLIDTVAGTKFLGVDIDNKLNWEDHTNTVCGKISKSIGIIKKVRHYFN